MNGSNQSGPITAFFSTGSAKVSSGFFSTVQFCIRKRWWGIIPLAMLTILFVFQFQFLKMDSTNEAFYLEQDKTRQLMEKFEKIFGNEDFTYILMETDDFFQEKNLRIARRLVEELKSNVPYVREVIYLGNSEYIEGIPGALKIRPFLEKPPENRKALRELRAKALAEEFYVDNLISRDAKTAGILMYFDPYPDEGEDPRKETPPAIYKVLAQPEFADVKLWVTGTNISDYELDKLTGEQLGTLILLSLLVELILLLFLLRSARGAILPMILVALSIIWCFGIISLIGWPLTSMIILLPSLLLCVGIADSVHVIETFNQFLLQGHDRKAAAFLAAKEVAFPCLLTSVTTMAGFLAFLGTDLAAIRQMGVYAALGVMVAFLFSFTLLPAMLSTRKVNSRKRTKKIAVDWFSRFLDIFGRTVVSHPRKIALIFIAVSTFVSLGITKIQIDTDIKKQMPEDFPFRQALEHVDSLMGGTMNIELMLNSRQADGVKNLSFIRQMEALDGFIGRHNYTQRTDSVLAVIKKMNKAMHEGKPEFYRIPDNPDELSEYFFLYETSGGDDLDKLVTFNFDTARLSIRTRTISFKQSEEFLNEIKNYVAENLDNTIQVEYTGLITEMIALSNHVRNGQKSSFIMAFLMITVLMILILRSVKLGLISMVPNVLPVLVALGIAGHLGLNMNISLMMFAPIIIGVSVDDTIHFFVVFRRKFQQTGNYIQAIRESISGVGRPLLFTTLVLVLGFAVFFFAASEASRNFGILSCLAFLIALLADFILVPALIILTRALGPEGKPVPVQIVNQQTLNQS